MPSQEDTRTDAERAAWEAQKAEQRQYQAEHKAWYDKHLTAEQRANLQQATAPAKGGVK